MTKNQLEYARLQEDIRHNLASEASTQADVQEKARHNVQTEVLSAKTLGLEANKLGETIRHNVAGEELSAKSIAMEGDKLQETVRHNYAQEGLTQSSINASYYSSGVGYANAAETARHNLAVEAENVRHNVASETATDRKTSVDFAGNIGNFIAKMVPVISKYAFGK